MLALSRKAARLSVQAGGLLLVAALHLLKPFLWLRLGRLQSERIGSLCLATEMYLRGLQLGSVPAGAVRLFVSPLPSNRQLLEMYKRHLRVIESPVLVKLFDICRPILARTPFFEPTNYERIPFRELGEGRATLSFTEEEQARGRRGLEEMGVKESDWFVCFHNRDSSYLKNEHPDRDWSYHDFRDCRAENFLEAARWIAQRGGFALRMGAVVAEPLPESARHPRIIDYAVKHRSDFLDIYLIAKARFIIGSDTGLAQVATVFDVPVVNTNVPFLDWASFRKKDVFILKKPYGVREGRILARDEILSRGLGRHVEAGKAQERLARQGVRYEENSPEEILEATREMARRLEGSYAARPGEEQLQDRYRALFGPQDACWGFSSRIGARFLEDNRAWLLKEHAAGVFREMRAERFLLRPLTRADVTERYRAWLDDAAAKRHIFAAGKPHALGDLRRYVAEREGRDDVLFLGIFEKASGRHIGNIKYEPLDRKEGFAVMGILIGEPDWRGKGAAGEVLAATGKRLKDEWGIREIVLGVDKENAGAIRAYEKVGFRREETRRIAVDPAKYLSMVWRL